ncbi:carbohydrate ABC transporter permease [Actinokineospora soli]|uniref:Carbohydrate ABC transporter permease n=1 Tax=Actinokineospora soli TaxID=1048753 RepID=A0ABW2TS57_9PSEU
MLYLALFIGPTLYSVYASFTNWDGINTPEWRGARNYAQLLDDPLFVTSFWNTLLILFVVGAGVFVLAFAFMLMLRDMRAKGFIRGVIFLPHIVSPIVLAIFWGFLLRHDGLLNALIVELGGEPVSWIGPDSAFLMIMVAMVWVSTGFYVAILMAGVDRIPAYFYEDASLAGASAWQKLRHITLPLSWDVISVAAVLWTISSIKVFEFIYAFGASQGYMPPDYEWNAAVFVYGVTMGGTSPQYRFGYASASAVLMLVLVTALVVLLRRAMRRDAVQF